jgi:hypothetical protein
MNSKGGIFESMFTISSDNTRHHERVHFRKVSGRKFGVVRAKQVLWQGCDYFLHVWAGVSWLASAFDPGNNGSVIWRGEF